MRRNIIVDVLFVIVYSLLLLMFGKASANVKEGGAKYAIWHGMSDGYAESSGNNHEK